MGGLDVRHMTVSDELPGGKCPVCEGKTVLVVAPTEWGTTDHDDDRTPDGFVEVHDEITGHYCLACLHLTSLSYNRA